VLRSPKWAFPSSFITTNLFVFLILSIQLILDLISLTIRGEEYKLWSSSLCNFLAQISLALSSHTPTDISSSPTMTDLISNPYAYTLRWLQLVSEYTSYEYFFTCKTRCLSFHFRGSHTPCRY
jgi:hypothetical protein